MFPFTAPAAGPAVVRYEDGGPEVRDIRPGDAEPVALTGLLRSLVGELERLTPEHVENLQRDDLRAVEKARNALRTRRRVDERRRGIPDDLTSPPLPALAEEEPDPILPLKLGKKRYAAYRETLLRVCGWCVYCGKTLDAESASLDHVLPRARDGENLPANLYLACVGCNQSKGADTPAGWAFRILTATNAPGLFEEFFERLDAYRNRDAAEEPDVIRFPGAAMKGGAA